MTWNNSGVLPVLFPVTPVRPRPFDLESGADTAAAELRRQGPTIGGDCRE